MTELRKKILKTFMVTPREVNLHGGPTEFFKKYPVLGMYFGEGKLYRDEKGRDMGMLTTRETLKECRDNAPYKLFVCADNAYVKGAKFRGYPLNSLGAIDDEALAYEIGKMIGMQCNDAGVDWVLHPSIDLSYSSEMYLAAISDSPEYNARMYRNVIRGIQDQGVAATVKHFPGLGTYFINMHIAAGKNILPFDEWMKTYGYTYKEAFRAGVSCVMTTHTTLTSYDSEGDNGYPPIATYSPKLTTDLLKGELGFDGVVVTDALIMGGMATGNIIEETLQAFKAGADVLLWPPIEAADRIEEALLSGEVPMSRLEDALARIDKMIAFGEGGKCEAPNAEYADDIYLRAVDKGMCCLRNEIGLLPINNNKHDRVLVVDVTDDDTVSSNMLADELRGRGYSVDVERDIYDVPSRVCWQDEIDALQSKYSLVIFNVKAYFLAEWGPSHMLIWASHMFDKSKKLIINHGTPHFANEYFPDDPTYVETNSGISKEAIKILVDKLEGKSAFTGKPRIKQIRAKR